MYLLAIAACASRTLPTSAWLGLIAATLLAAASACSPALDWREVRLNSGALTALFPCKPTEQSRDAALLGAPVRMTLHSCQADGATYALTQADVLDPARVPAALLQMQAALAGNIGAVAIGPAPFRIKGLPPGAEATRLRLRGRLPDGDSVEAQAVFFARTRYIYQAVVLGKAGSGDAADTFFEALRLAT